MRRHEDWLKQADSDLCAAEDSASSTHYEWACFQAQQAAEKALNLLKKKLIDLDFRRDWIPEFINYIEQCIKKGVILLILFGSRAKYDFHGDSDIDILIVSRNLPDDVRERAPDFFSDSLPVQPFVMTLAELMERIEKLDFLIFDAFEDGLILYSDMDMGLVNERIKASKERFGLKRVKNGWKFDAAAAEAAGI